MVGIEVPPSNYPAGYKIQDVRVRDCEIVSIKYVIWHMIYEKCKGTLTRRSGEVGRLYIRVASPCGGRSGVWMYTFFQIKEWAFVWSPVGAPQIHMSAIEAGAFEKLGMFTPNPAQLMLLLLARSSTRGTFVTIFWTKSSARRFLELHGASSTYFIPRS